jgi:copper chaperone NosL
MQKRSRILIAVSAVLLLSTYFLPLWKIILEAPQYPEGLGMKIWINDITGNVEQINGLNHYIGMKHIIVDDFIEFKILPYILGFLICLGLATAIKGSKTLLWVWVISLIAFAVIGLTDFYLWEYDYGHNLDPKAAIKVEGMSYQPPLIGYKQLLNFIAGSFPDIGGIVAFIAGSIAIAVLYYEQRLVKKTVSKTNMMENLPKLILLLCVVFASCSREPEPIQYGKDMCEHCKMTMMDNKFGAEIVTSKGKVFKFDAIECMVDYIKTDGEKLNSPDNLLLTINVALPGTLIDARTAFYLNDNAFKSPMGANLASFNSKQLAENNLQNADGKILTWDELLRTR